MPDGTAKLNEQIVRLRSLPGLIPRIAPAVARVVERKLNENISKGIGPDGAPWPLRKADGGLALQSAGKALSVNAVGNVIVCRLTGIFAKHNYGAVRGKVKRRIIPKTRVPGPMADAIREVLAGEFRATMKSGGAT